MDSVPRAFQSQTVSDFLREHHVTLESLQIVLAELNIEWESLPAMSPVDHRPILTSGMRTRLSGFRWSSRHMAQTVKINVTSVREIIAASPYADSYRRHERNPNSARLYTGVCYCHVLSRTGYIRKAIPLGADWELFKDSMASLGISTRSYRSYRKRFPELGLPQPANRRALGGVFLALPKTEIERLRVWLPGPAEAGWYTLADISRKTGWSTDKIRNYAVAEAVPVRLYRLASGSVNEHYALTSFEEIKQRPQLSEAESAEQWYTYTQLHKELGAPRVWLNLHLNKSVGRSRPGRRGILFPHYPASEYQRLWRLLHKYPRSGDWLTTHAIVRLTGRWTNWVDSRLNYDLAEFRWANTNGRLLMHFPPEEVARLVAINNSQPSAAGDWLSANGLKVYTGKSSKWVSAHLLRSEGQPRTTINGRVTPHYPPTERDRLFRLAHPSKES